MVIDIDERSSLIEVGHVTSTGWQVVSLLRQSVGTVSGTENDMDHRRRKRCFQRKPSLVLDLMVRVPPSMPRAGQSKRVHFVVSGSLDFPVTGSPKESAVHD